MITNTQSGTSIHEVAEGIYRINTPVSVPGGPASFSFNQYLIVDDQPLIFHTGLRRMFPLVHEAVGRVLPVERLSHIGLSHFEADECGSLNEWLAVAPEAVPLCGKIAALVSVNDVADRPARALGDGEQLSLGTHTVRWFDTPHLPHAWECGFLFESRTKTLLCGDLFTQGGEGQPPLTESDILGPSEAFRGQMDYYAHAVNTRAMLERLAAERPTTLACMHGSAWRGDGATLILALADVLDQERKRKA
ncbi:MAG: MBL fold metallo-hydrolase [Candidatus Rokubacteria bacterium]|nr:MBL fold metallo-hydrolase [Candidatus Rokubacteria bacterium]